MPPSVGLPTRWFHPQRKANRPIRNGPAQELHALPSIFKRNGYLLSRFSATASRMRFFSARSLIMSFSLMSMARLTFP